jgi:predicted ATPase/DNA-binding SARP family transcriptional activator
MTRLSICLFGPFQVTLDGEPVTTLESDKVRALLAYLAVEAEKPQRREKLAGLLWPDRPERSARANLSHALTNLRQAIDDRDATPPFLNISWHTIQFNRDSDAQIDVVTFKELLTAQRSCAQVGKPLNQQTMQRFADAIELYRGNLLEGFSLSDSPGFEEWVLFEREWLHRQAMEALDRLCEWYCEERDEVELALQYAWRQVELDPSHESAHRQVMRLLHRSGQRAAALAQYKACCQRLAAELGVEPSAETVALFERIRRESRAPTSSTTVPHNLRAPLTPFVGRKAELARLADRLRDPGCRLLTLVGPGGIGKTRLALEAARAHMTRFPQGVFQVRLVGLQSPEAIVPTIAGAIGFSFHRQGEPRQQLLDYLHEKTMLLILDNFEHLLVGVDTVIDILRAAPHVTAMITSRTRLNLKGEHLFPVEGMEVPPLEAQAAPILSSIASAKSGGIPSIPEYDAVQLFVSGARRVCPDFQLTDHASHVARICQLVGGMPLAILLAAAWIRSLSPAEIATRIDQDLDLLEADWRDVPQRHRSVRGVFDHSWRLLVQRERELFQALSVFRGSFDKRAARQIVGASAHELQALLEKSFIHRLPTPSTLLGIGRTEERYEVHELLRQYASEKLDATPIASEAMHDRHCAYYTAALQRWGEDLKGAQQLTAVAELDADAENARAAWDFAVARQRIERLDQALEGLCLFYEWQVRYQEGETACRVASETLGPEVPRDNLRVRARLLIWQGAFNRLMERVDSAARVLQESENVLDQPALAGQDLRDERAFLMLQRGYLVINFDRKESREWFEGSLALYRALGDDWGAASALRGLGRIAQYFGPLEKARQLMAESLAIRNTLGDKKGIADSLMGLGTVLMYQGQVEEAERLLRESIAVFREIGSQFDAADGLGTLGTILITRGKYDEAHAALEESVSTHSAIRQTYHLAHWSAFLGAAKMRLGRYQEARAQSEMTCALSDKVGYPRGGGLAYWVLGDVALATEAYAEACVWFQKSAVIQRRIGQKEDLCYALTDLACAVLRLGQLTQARRHLHEALRTAAEIQSVGVLWHALPATALLFADLGEHERAVELYALASRYPIVSNSLWFQDVAGRRIATAATILPTDVVAAAQARGLAQDLWTVVAELVEELASRA